jgi:hypothetical protein
VHLSSVEESSSKEVHEEFGQGHALSKGPGWSWEKLANQHRLRSTEGHLQKWVEELSEMVMVFLLFGVGVASRQLPVAIPPHYTAEFHHHHLFLSTLAKDLDKCPWGYIHKVPRLALVFIAFP